MPFKSEIFTCQRVLAITVFFGFMLHHTLRVNISIAIVEMITRNNSNIEEDHGPRYLWDEEEKNDILGYFFWGYVLTQIPGGRLSEKFGTKIVVAIGLLASSILTLLTPLAANFGYRWLVFIRFCLGVALGIHWPSTPPIATKWIAPEAMSTFSSHMTASSLGVAIALPVCGYLIAYLDWPSVFYVTGSLAMVWSLTWCYLIYDTPEKHPRINTIEKEKLRSKIPNVDLGEKRPRIPWRQILTSGPVWSIINGNTFASCTFFIAFNQLPTYMSQVLRFDIRANGLISGLPYLVRYFMSLLTAIAADKLIKSKRLSKTTVRKFCNVIFFLGTCILFAMQALWGYNSIVTIAVFTGSFALMGFITSGFFANCMDIAPAYSGTIFGISQVPAAIAGYITTKVVGLITKEKQGFEQWAYVFWMLVGVNSFATVISYVFTSGEEQSWNLRSEEKEIEKLESNYKEGGE